MEPIAETSVDKTWQEVAGFNPNKFSRVFQEARGKIKKIYSEGMIEC